MACKTFDTLLCISFKHCPNRTCMPKQALCTEEVTSCNCLLDPWGEHRQPGSLNSYYAFKDYSDILPTDEIINSNYIVLSMFVDFYKKIFYLGIELHVLSKDSYFQGSFSLNWRYFIVYIYMHCIYLHFYITKIFFVVCSEFLALTSEASCVLIKLVKVFIWQFLFVVFARQLMYCSIYVFGQRSVRTMQKVF